jgi:excisionase family DNA binding protein
MENSDFYTIRDLAGYLGISGPSVRKLIREGKLDCVNLQAVPGKRPILRIPKGSVGDFIRGPSIIP